MKTPEALQLLFTTCDSTTLGTVWFNALAMAAPEGYPAIDIVPTNSLLTTVPVVVSLI